MKYTNILIGADPELFLKKDDKYISSVGKIGGTKREPLPIDSYGTAIQEDNVAVEYNIPPTNSVNDFIAFNTFALSHLGIRAKKLGLSLSIDASALFTDDELCTPQAMIFGCDPDWNAWLNEQNQSPEINEQTYYLRSAGGHIHIGYTKPTEEANIALVKAMDLFVGAPSIEYDTDTKRRSLYGKPGAFRHKKYGVEYRTLSNFWIASSDLMRWVYSRTLRAVEFLNTGNTIKTEHFAAIHSAINNLDYPALRTLQEEYGV